MKNYLNNTNSNNRNSTTTRNSNMSRETIITNKNLYNSNYNNNINYNNNNNINNDSPPGLMILSWNEGVCKIELNNQIVNATGKKYSLKCKNIIDKINIENPTFIFVCTQESKASGQNHFQHILGELLPIHGYTRLHKEDCSIYLGSLFVTNKNVRTRIYYKQESVSLNNLIKLLKPKSSEDETYESNQNVNQNTEYKIIEFGSRKSKESGLGKLYDLTPFKGSIFSRLVIKNNNNQDIKIIVVNSHLYFGEKSDGTTGLEQRTKQFFSLINEFDLPNYYKKGYNIFFCGDLNFRFIKKNMKYPIKNEKEILKMSEEIITQYRKDNFNKSYNNELYKAIRETYLNLNTNHLMQAFLKNAKFFGQHLTCKLSLNPNGNEEKCSIYPRGLYNCVIKEKKLFMEKYAKTHFRPPAECDKILVASHNNISFNKDDYTTIRVSNLSDHRALCFVVNFL